MSKFMNTVLNKVHKGVVCISIGITVITTGVFAYRTYEILFVPPEKRFNSRQEENELINNEQLLNKEH